MAKLLGISIDLAKIDKNRIKPGKNGQKYYDVSIMVNDQEDQYGKDVQVWEGQTKEEREAKSQRNFLGNGKTVWDGGSVQATPTKPSPVPAAAEEENDGLPF